MTPAEPPSLEDALRLARRLPPRERARLIARLADELADAPTPNTDRFLASFDAWQDTSSASEIVRSIRESRASNVEPPEL